jgi:epsilon-lactone hydrolase
MSLRTELLRLGIRFFLKEHSPRVDVEGWRRGMRSMERLAPTPPAGTETVQIKAGRLTLLRVKTPASHPQRHVLYLHGGAYIAGSPANYRHFSWRIANVANACIWLLDYRLAPEHPYPAALEDAVAAYHWLRNELPDLQQLFVMGESAGGGLTLCLLLKLRDEGTPLPDAAVAISPWTDLALTGASLRSNAMADPMLNAEHVPALAKFYLAGADPRTPYASPLYGDPSGLPPVLIQVGSDEILRDDGVRMADKLRQANPRSRLEIGQRMPHCWPLFVPILAEAGQAIVQIGEFVSSIQS